MVMQFSGESSLFSHQAGRRMSEIEAYKYFIQTVAAVEYLHSNDIMHRDIKVGLMPIQPENILMDSLGDVKLCDFGWATHNIDKKRKTICGTYDYMAPQLIFEELYDCSVDIWALGILLYELLHGVTPFPQDSLEYARKTMKRIQITYSESISQ